MMLRQQNCIDLEFDVRDTALQGQYLINLNNLGPLLLTWFNFNPSMDK